MFGIAWGVGSLLLLVGLGEGFRAGNRKQFDSLGENVMFIWSGRAPVMQGSFTALRQYYLDLPRLSRIFCASAPASARPHAGHLGAATSARSATSTRPAGRSWECPPSFNQIRYLPINEGRWINRHGRCAETPRDRLGDEARRTLFPGRPAVGATILLNGVRFTVIGTLQRIGHGDNMNQNLQSYRAVSRHA